MNEFNFIVLMTKTIMILAIAAAFVVGSIGTGTIAYAGDDDDDEGVLQTLLCPAGKALTGIVSGGGDDDDGGGILDLICNAQIEGPQGPPGADGNDGAPGADGNDGAPGADGNDGAPGANGNDGAPGADGNDGAPGADGNDGAPGADGNDGAPGLSGYEIVSTSSTVTISTGTTTFLSVTCPIGKEVLGGGYQIGSLSTGEASTLFITENHPLGDSIWIVGIVKTVGTSPATFTYLVFAQCANT